MFISCLLVIVIALGTQSCFFAQKVLAQQWTQLPVITGNAAYDIHVHKGMVYVSSGNGNVLISPDSSKSWQTVSLENSFSPGPLTSTDEYVFVGGYGGGLLRSADSAATWQQAGSIFVNQPISHIHALGSDVWVATATSVFRGRSQGVLWEERKDGLPINAIPRMFTATGQTLWLATFGNGVFRWNESLRRWESMNNGLFDVRISAVEVFEGVLYAATPTSGVFRYSAIEQRWQNISVGLPTGQAVNVLCAGGGRLFAGTAAGVFTLTQSVWQAVNNNSFPTQSSVLCLAVIADTLFAGTNNRGLWKIGFQTVSVQEPKNISAHLYQQGKFIVLSDALPRNKYTLTIFNLCGQIVFSGEITPGNKFSLPLSPSVVAYMLQGDKYTEKGVLFVPE